MAPEQSPHFEAVSRELQLGGTAYVYADIDGDAERAADFLLSLLRDLPELAPPRGTSQLSAKSLVRTHLPKIERAYLRYGGQAMEHGAYTMLEPVSPSCQLTVALPSHDLQVW